MKISSHPQPQLTTDELQQLKWLLGGALTLLSVCTVFYLDINAWVLMAVAMPGVGVALVRPDWPALIPRWAHRLTFPFIVAFFVGDLWLSGEVLPAMVRLDILLLFYRGITYRKKRDDLQVIVLGLFLVVVAGVLTVSLTFAVQILAFTACALVFLLVITLAEAGDGAGRVKDNAPCLPGWARDVKWARLLGRVRQVTDWRVVALGGGLFAGLVVLSALLFLAIPRFQLENSFFLERFITKKAKTGFSDTIRFGDVTEIQQDNSVALSVDVSDRRGIPVSPYWRMLVLDEYRDGTFRLSPTLRRDAFSREIGGTNVRGRRRAEKGEPVYWTFYLESGVSRFLPLLGGFETLRFQEPQHFRFARTLGVVALRDEPVTMTAYRVEGMEGGVKMDDPEFAEKLRQRADNPRTAANAMLRLGVGPADRAVLERIVREIENGAATPSSRGQPERRDGGVAPPETETVGASVTKFSAEEFARRAGEWLGRRHAYSLEPKIPAGAGDPLVRWVASDGGGHCELFAGSLVLLARAAGIPARVVTGFRGGSWNGYSNNFTLRNSDAHAWCEVFDAAAGAWLRTDPTPGASAGMNDDNLGEAGLARRLDRSWTARLDSLRVFWYRRIVSFDQRSQMETLKAVKEATEDSGRRARAVFERIAAGLKTWIATPWTARRGTMAVLLAAFATGAIWAARNFRGWNFNFPTGETHRGVNAVRREAGRWLARLQAKPATTDERAGLMRDLQRLRFGAKETWGNATEIFRRARNGWREMKRRRAESPAPR